MAWNEISYNIFRNLILIKDFLIQGHMACSEISYTIQKFDIYSDVLSQGYNL